MPGEIEIDNKSSPNFTKLSIEVSASSRQNYVRQFLARQGSPNRRCDAQVKDYPGLLRVIAWVINGLDLLVENAK